MEKVREKLRDMDDQPRGMNICLLRWVDLQPRNLRGGNYQERNRRTLLRAELRYRPSGGKTRLELRRGKWKRSTAAYPFEISEHQGQREDCKSFQREKMCHQQRVRRSLLSDRSYHHWKAVEQLPSNVWGKTIFT